MTEAATAPHQADDRRWGLGEVAVGFVVAQLGGLVATSVVLSASGRSLEQVDDLPLELVAVAQLGLWFGFLGAALYATEVKGHGLVQDLGLRARWGDVWRGGLAGAALQLVVLPLVYWPLLELLDRSAEDLEGPAQSLADRADGALGAVLLVAIVGIGAPIVEEIFYRGLLQQALLKRGLPVPLAVGLTAVVFAVSHLQMLQLPGLLLAGLLFGVLAHRSGRLGPAIAAHVAFNMVTVVALLAT